ncbi:MAG: tetratricopeptide repeat protein [Nannocystaceae bacterium]
MRLRALMIAAALGLTATACDKEGEGSKEPGADELAVLEGMEPGTSPQPATPEEKKAAAQEAAKNLPKVQDRDPEEEKRKMAQSRQRSAQARKLLEQKKFSEAVTNARAALKIHEQNVDAMMILGEVFYREGKHELVVSVTTTALAVDEKVRTPKDTSAVYNLQGFALASLGKDQMATQAFKKAAEADDQNAAAWNNLGTRYLRAGDVNTAASCFAYAIELEPSFAKAHLNHGAALRAQGKLEEAEKAIRKAMELQRNYPEAHFNLGVLYLDAPQIREMTTTQRLNTAISELERYKQLAGGRKSSEPLAKGLGSKKRIAPVSVERADDYIRLARKGIEREERAAKRKAERAAKAAEKEDDATAAETDTGDAAATPASDGDDDAPAKPEGTQAPAKPGGSPQAPAKPGGGSPQAPAKPGGGSPQAPAKPGGGSPQAPAKPGGESPQAPAKPGGGSPQAPAKPGGGSPQAPAKPAPKKPGADPKPPADEPAKPSAPAKPSQPAPKQPSPSAPQKPAPQKPQKPGQKSAKAGNPLRCTDTKLVGARCSEADTSTARAQAWPPGLGPTRVRT